MTVLGIAVGRVDDLSVDDAMVAPAWMGSDELQRMADRPAASRREFVAGRALLRQLLQTATGVPAHEWLICGQAGAAPMPRRRSSPEGEGDLGASVSHRLGWVAAAVAHGPVGIDIECQRPPRTSASERAALMLTRSEHAIWRGLAKGQREGALLTAWTAKESWFKASPAGAALWDFRDVGARACAQEQANVRVWTSPPLYVAVCCADSAALSAARCDGLPDAAAISSFWHVAPAAVA